MIRQSAIIDEEQRVRQMLNIIPDPEVPVLTVNDLGIIRNVIVHIPSIHIEVEITPTYSGCPAMDTIAMNIRLILVEQGYNKITITKVLSPAWTTEWMSESGKQKLKAFGIAPPHGFSTDRAELFALPAMVQCPLCNSMNTTRLSEFGSTACKSLYQCNDCSEPFDYFKCH